MVELRLKVGPKGQVLIPKPIRERYGIQPGGYVIVELRNDGLMLRGKPSTEDFFKKLSEHRRIVQALGVKAGLGDLKGVSLELEFEEV